MAVDVFDTHRPHLGPLWYHGSLPKGLPALEGNYYVSDSSFKITNC